MELKNKWDPPFTKDADGNSHVRGSYTDRIANGDGTFEDQTIEIVCVACGAEHRQKCSSGMVRQHIQSFGVAHAHCLGDKFVEEGRRR